MIAVVSLRFNTLTVGGVLTVPQQAILTFEDDQLDRALENLKKAQRIICIEHSKKQKVELDEWLMRQILCADCELYMALLTFLKQGKLFLDVYMIKII